MAGKSEIEWTGHTWNPLAGCKVLSPGCKRCYAMRLAKRLAAMGQALYAGLTENTKGGAVWTGEVRKAPQHTILEPLLRRKPTTWFVNSMSDLFYEEVPDAWIDEVFAIMALTPRHTYQPLTKRAERMLAYMTDEETPQRIARKAYEIWAQTRAPDAKGNLRVEHTRDAEGLKDASFELAEWPLPNVWMGVSAEDQDRANERIPSLLRTPAAVRFISAEPLLGPIDLTKILLALGGAGDPDYFVNALTGEASWDGEQPTGLTGKLHWVIVGGESGQGYRDMDLDWPDAIGWQCKGAGVAFFMKQMAGKKPIPPDLFVRQFPEAAL